MIDQKYILLILSCYKYKYKAERQIETWLKKLDNNNNNSNNNIIYFHVIGDVEKCKKNDTNYFFDFHNKILYTKTKDDYLSLPHKVITALEAVNHTYNYDYIFKTDDDQELVDDDFFNKMMTTLSTKNYNYGGRLLNVNDHYSTYYTVHSELPKKLLLRRTSYCSGRFYFLSKASVIDLLDKKEHIKEHVIEDHAIGYYMDDDLKKNALHFLSDRFFRDIPFYK
jgi:hypothetical protein